MNDEMEEKFTLVSVLQELTAEALYLFDSETPVDSLLERISERLDLRVSLALKRGEGGCSLIGSAGLSRSSRGLPLPRAGTGLQSAALPYPEIAGTAESRWEFGVPLDGGGEDRIMLLFFSDPRAPLSEKWLGMLETLVSHFRRIFLYRESLARARKAEGDAMRANSLLEERVQERTEELRRSRDRLVQSEKMSAVGQLAAGVAHEINNPLGIILGFAQGLAGRIKDGDPMCLPLRSIEREAVRCKNLVQDLLVFSRSSNVEGEPVDLNEALSGALSMISAHAKTRGVAIVSELSPDLPRLPANKHKIQQVLINLANNAIDAMPKGGTLTIATSLSDGRPGYAELSVRDTGHGIAKEIQTRVMEPFFTTKETGQGTGLGLALVYEIVKKHNGSVELESEAGKGTRFTIFLPLRGAFPPSLRP